MIDVGIVIVIYKRKIDLTESYISIMNCLKQDKSIHGHVIVYDNSPLPQVVYNTGICDIHYYHNSNNVGVIPAYKYAIDYCKAKGISWLLRLDQDSIFDNSLLDSFKNFHMHKECDKYLAVVPKVICNNVIKSPSIIKCAGLYKAINPRMSGVSPFRVTFINSASFINVSNSKILKAIDECLFMLDLSDHDIAYQLNSDEIYILDVFVKHSLSTSEAEYVDIDRYRRIIDAEIMFSNKYYSRGEKAIFKCRLFFRIFKNICLGRFMIAHITFRRLLSI